MTLIYIEAKENFRFCYHFHVGKTEEENRYIQVDSHLRFIGHSLWRLTLM